MPESQLCSSKHIIQHRKFNLRSWTHIQTGYQCEVNTVHPFYSLILNRVQSKQRQPNNRPLPPTLLGEILRFSKGIQNTWSLQHVFVLPQGLRAVGHAERFPGINSSRCLNHLSWLVLMWGSSCTLGAPLEIGRGAWSPSHHVMWLATNIHDLFSWTWVSQPCSG